MPVRTMDNLVKRVRSNWESLAPGNQDKFPEYATIGQTFTDADIEAVAIAANYLNGPGNLLVKDVSERIYRTLMERHFAPRTVMEGVHVLPGIKAALLGASATTTGHRASTALPANAVDLHAPDVTFSARIGVEGSPAAVQGWEIGITQTVLHVQRRFVFRVDTPTQGTWVQESTTALPAPTNDRNEGAQAPWYSSFKALTPGTTFCDVDLHDMPGENFNVDQGAQVKAIQREGSDRFGTWIILWHPATQTARFLGSWTWTVDYNDATGTRLQVSQFSPLLGTGSTPADAVLLGNRCRDVLVSTKPNPRRETQADTQAFQHAALNDQTRAAFDRVEQVFVAALPGRDAGVLRTTRDQLLTAWRALIPTEQSARKGRLLTQLFAYEDSVNHRIPSQLALMSQYQIQT